MDTLPDVTPYEAASLLYGALQVVATLDAASIQEQPYSAPLPRGFLCCGEACTLIPALVILILKAYPHLMDPENFAQMASLALIHSAGGDLN